MFGGWQNRSTPPAAVRGLGTLLLMCGASVAQTTGGAEEDLPRGPAESVQAQVPTTADSGDSAKPREPLAPQFVYRLPAPVRTGRSRAGAAGGEDGPKLPVLQVGFGRDLGQLLGGVLADGVPLRWMPAPDGGLATALGVASPGAKALRLRLVMERVPRGLEVRVYDAAGTVATLAPVPTQQMPAGEGGSADLWTPTVPGELATVELYLPPGVAPGGLKVSIPALSHFETDLTGYFTVPIRGRCAHDDAGCAADGITDAARRAVARHRFTTGPRRSSPCTGTLLNGGESTTRIPGCLTAWHGAENRQETSSRRSDGNSRKSSECATRRPDGEACAGTGESGRVEKQRLASAWTAPPRSGI